MRIFFIPFFSNFVQYLFLKKNGIYIDYFNLECFYDL